MLSSFAEAKIYALRLAGKTDTGPASRIPAQLRPYQTRQDWAVRHCDGRPAPDVRLPRAPHDLRALDVTAARVPHAHV